MNDQNQAIEPEDTREVTTDSTPLMSGNPEPSDPKPKISFYKQPRLIAAALLILAAFILLGMWFCDRGQTAATPLPTATRLLTLVAPHVDLDVEPSPGVTSSPAATLELPAATATVEPRDEVITYTIREGESVASIAAKFGLWPETILWSNRYELGVDLANYTAGETIFILPVDGVYHAWSAGEGLGAVSAYYGVTADAVIDYPGNNLDRATLGGLSNPNITAGTRLVIPGGTLPDYFANDSLLYYAAVEKLRSLPLGTAETFPAPRTEIIAYEVKALDSIFSIAEEFGLEPETILWTNRYLIGDTPDGITPGQKLIILPEDGVYHAWLYGEGMNGVSSGYGVTVDDILSEPMNNLDVEDLGELSKPRIMSGTFVYIPGGRGATPSWVSYVTDPDSPTGSHPNVSYLGGFACNTNAWLVGSGSFILPTGRTAISGYEYNPPVHNGLDYDGETGDALYAVDNGVVIYAGWSDRGYGNTIVIDHGNGYMSLYAHLMDGGVYSSCGATVYSGTVIGAMGSTGNSTGSHLHFELRYNGSPVNPHGFGL